MIRLRPGAAARDILHTNWRASKRNELEREREREIYTVVGTRELVSHIEGPEFVRITRDLAHS